MRAIANGEDKLKSYVGTPLAEPLIYEHWVPTSLLVELVFWHKRQAQSGRDTIETVARNIAELIRDSSAGRREFVERTIRKSDETHMLLLNSVTKILNEMGIELNTIK